MTAGGSVQTSTATTAKTKMESPTTPAPADYCILSLSRFVSRGSDSGCSSLWSKKNYITINHQVVVGLEEEEEAMSVSSVWAVDNEGGARRV
jgi:hypothetical protein